MYALRLHFGGRRQTWAITSMCGGLAAEELPLPFAHLPSAIPHALNFASTPLSTVSIPVQHLPPSVTDGALGNRCWQQPTRPASPAPHRTNALLDDEKPHAKMFFTRLTTPQRQRATMVSTASRRGETLKESSKEKDVRISNIVAAKGTNVAYENLPSSPSPASPFFLACLPKKCPGLYSCA